MNRRNFFEKSLLVTGGLVVAPLYVSCDNDDDISGPGPDMEQSNFHEGVASFDPLSTAVVIWTRFRPPTELEGQTISVNWQVAKDKEFSDIVRNGQFETDSNRDYTIGVDVQGLESNSKYFYRFYHLETSTISVIGETITLPSKADNVSEVKLAVCSCANYAAGLFNVYNAMAKSEADVIVHLGDYIYEYGVGQYGTNENTVVLGREHKPVGEIVQIDEYRERYRQYRQDKDLQLAHQKKPFICVWDDHEITNDAYKDGAENHQENEGDYQERKDVAIKVYSEFLPLRSNDPSKIYRSFDFGSIASLHMLDTRIIGRDKQLEFGTFIDPATGVFDGQAFQQALLDPSRALLGQEQLTWLSGVVGSSSASWQVLGQQVLMGKMFMPQELLVLIGQIVAGNTSPEVLLAFQNSLKELTTIKTRLIEGDTTLTDEEKNRVTTVVPYNLDAWDGYFVEREQLYAALGGKKMICLAGDTHNAWHSILKNAEGKEIGVEFATSSVSSPGFEEYIGLEPTQVAGFQLALATLIDDLQYSDASQRGYLMVTFSAGSAVAKWNFINTIATESYIENTGKTISYS